MSLLLTKRCFLPSRLLEEVLHYINTVASSVEGNVDKPTAKFWRVLLNKSYDMLDKVCLISRHVSSGTFLLLLINMIITFVGFLLGLGLIFIGWSATWCIIVLTHLTTLITTANSLDRTTRGEKKNQECLFLLVSILLAGSSHFTVCLVEKNGSWQHFSLLSDKMI